MTAAELQRKPLGGKAYGHIPHLTGSRMGPGDHHCHEGQTRICTQKKRDQHDRIIVTEKLDGACVAVAKLEDGNVVALMRAGYRCDVCPYESLQRFAGWVRAEEYRFHELLAVGERICGEWLTQAVGTRYKLPHEPFVVFDIMRGPDRVPFDEVTARVMDRFVMPRVISDGEPISIATVLTHIDTSGHGALEPVEGAVWRVERKGAFDFIAKWVRPDKIDGKYLVGKPEAEGRTEHLWNDWPGKTP